MASRSLPFSLAHRPFVAQVLLVRIAHHLRQRDCFLLLGKADRRTNGGDALRFNDLAVSCRRLGQSAYILHHIQQCSGNSVMLSVRCWSVFPSWTSVHIAWSPDPGRKGRRPQQRLIASEQGTLAAHKSQPTSLQVQENARPAVSLALIRANQCPGIAPPHSCTSALSPLTETVASDL